MTDEYSQWVARDHFLHWAATLAVAIWSGLQFHWWVGLIALIGLWLVISLTNVIVLSRGGSLPTLRFVRWGWIGVSIGLIIYLSAEVTQV